MISMNPSPTFTSSLVILDVLPSLPCQIFGRPVPRPNLPPLDETEDGDHSDSDDSDDSNISAKLEMDLVALESDFDSE
jgi:hypothetical protein